jgi:hypothetical protein
MRIEKVQPGLQTIFYNRLYKILQVLRIKGVNFTIVTHSEDIATIKVQVSGLKGLVEKNIVLYREFDGWIAISDSKKFYLESFSMVTDVVRRFINKSRNLVSKI